MVRTETLSGLLGSVLMTMVWLAYPGSCALFGLTVRWNAVVEKTILYYTNHYVVAISLSCCAVSLIK
jgi:hypothetical protein